MSFFQIELYFFISTIASRIVFASALTLRLGTNSGHKDARVSKIPIIFDNLSFSVTFSVVISSRIFFAIVVKPRASWYSYLFSTLPLTIPTAYSSAAICNNEITNSTRFANKLFVIVDSFK